VLHLRQKNYYHEVEFRSFEAVSRCHEMITFLTHRWANSFFDYMHKRSWCPKLDTLVICSYVEDSMELEDEYVYCPQHCFVKGFQTDVLGRSGAIAVPVTRAMIRDRELCAEILKYDPMCNWVGDRPGPPNTERAN